MFRKFLNSLFTKSAKPAPAPKTAPLLRLGSASLSRHTVFGNHRYRTALEDSTVYYNDEGREIHRMLVDKMGNIKDFPGIYREEFWTRQVTSKSLHPQIRFRTDFVIREGQFAMLWQIQPDGRYWEDSDGFGGTDDEEIILFALLDEDGHWDGPFRIYSIGSTVYYQNSP